MNTAVVVVVVDGGHHVGGEARHVGSRRCCCHCLVGGGGGVGEGHAKVAVENRLGASHGLINLFANGVAAISNGLDTFHASRDLSFVLDIPLGVLGGNGWAALLGLVADALNVASASGVLVEVVHHGGDVSDGEENQEHGQHDGFGFGVWF